MRAWGRVYMPKGSSRVMGNACAGGYFLDEFLCGQLGVTRALGNFTSDAAAAKQPDDRLKYRTSSDGQPLTFGGPLIAGECLCLTLASF